MFVSPQETDGIYMKGNKVILCDDLYVYITCA